MITEDQLEQLTIQWFQDTGGVNIEHRTPNIEILWLKLNQSKVFERRRGVLRVFVGYRGNTKFPQPIQQ
jgi:hypothetical protein